MADYTDVTVKASDGTEYISDATAKTNEAEANIGHWCSLIRA